jgi:hypothetical protein
MTRTTGQCVGTLSAGLGQCQLSSLSLNAFVNKDSSLTISHPTDPDKVDIAIANPQVPVIVSENRGSGGFWPMANIDLT